jgi:hypothetical protein
VYTTEYQNLELSCEMFEYTLVHFDLLIVGMFYRHCVLGIDGKIRVCIDGKTGTT